MSNIYNKIEKINFLLLTIILSLYFAIRIKKNFLAGVAMGDEGGFVRSLALFNDKGWEFSNIKGASMIFNSLGYVFNLLLNNYLLSLKLVSFLSSIGSILLLYLIGKNIYSFSNKYMKVYLLTISNVFIVSSFMFSAYNDNLLIFLLIAITYVFLLYKKSLIVENKFIIIIGVLLGAFFSIRLMAIIYIPSFLILFLFEKKIFKIKTIVSIISLLVITMVIISFPSIKEKQSFSYHNKDNPGKNVSWVQLQYLSALENDKGQLRKKQYHVSTDYVEKYLEINGVHSLPNSNIEAIFFDFKFTVKEFFRDFAINFKFIFRLSGLMMVLFLISFFKTKKIKDVFLLYFSFVYLGVISFIVISYVESRWVIGVILLLTLFSFVNQEKNKQMDGWLIQIHVLFLTVMNIPFVIDNIKFLIEL